MQKFIAMMLVGAFLFAGTVGCGGEGEKTKGKDKDAKPVEKKEKDKM